MMENGTPEPRWIPDSPAEVAGHIAREVGRTLRMVNWFIFVMGLAILLLAARVVIR